MKFESQETVTGRVRGSDEWIEYEAILRVKDSEKKPVSLELKFVPPHPFVVNMAGHASSKYIWRYVQPSRADIEEAVEDLFD